MLQQSIKYSLEVNEKNRKSEQRKESYKNEPVEITELKINNWNKK